MKLCALSLRNWRNIAELDLPHLDVPFVVLSGPNRIGKSSLFAAIRCGLIDFDHDSRDALIREAVPWQSQWIPEVAVEFETAGARYRIHKKFSPLREGFALLEQQIDGSWQTLQRGKEASRTVRELLQTEKSKQGLLQLAWLDQGETRLPEPGRLDGSLRKRMHAVVQSLVTGRDWEFEERLRDRSTKLYTLDWEPRKPTDHAQLRARVEEFAAEKQRLADERERQAALLREYDASNAELDRALRGMQAAQAAVRRLSELRDQSRERRAAFRAAEQDLQRAQQEVLALERQLADLSELRERVAAERVKVAAFERAASDCDRQRELCAQAVEDAVDELDAAGQRLLRCEQDRRRLQALVRLRQTEEELRRLRAELQAVAAREEELRASQAEWHRLPDLDAGLISELQRLVREAEELRLRLEAEAVHVALTPRAAGTATVLADENPPARLDLLPDTPTSVQLHRHAEIELPGWGTVQIVRGGTRTADDAAPEESLLEAQRAVQRRLAELGTQLPVTGRDPAEWTQQLAQIVQRRKEADAAVRRLQDEMRRLHPHAPQALRGKILELEAAAAHLRDELESAPASAGGAEDPAGGGAVEEADGGAADLTVWTQRLAAADARSAELRREQQRLEHKLRQDRKRLDSAAELWQQARLEYEKATTRYSGLCEQIEKSDELALRARLEAARQAAAGAERRLEENRLSEAERHVERDLESALKDLEREQQEHAAVLGRRNRMEGELSGFAGLSQRIGRIDAELQTIRSRLADFELNLRACRRLTDLFQEVREEQVQQASSLIGDQVVRGAQRLGLTEVSAVESGAGPLPSALVYGQMMQPVPLHADSFGTAEQLALIVRLAVAGLLAKQETQVAIFDDPLAHADRRRCVRMLEILRDATRGMPDETTGLPTTGPLQVIVLTCHPEWFEHLDAVRIDLRKVIRNVGS